MENSKQKYALTMRQKDAYDFIIAYTKANGFSPTYEEIREDLELNSVSGVHRLCYGLKERGWIDFLPSRSRSITVL